MGAELPRKDETPGAATPGASHDKPNNEKGVMTMMAGTTNTSKIPACPPWCQESPGHEYEFSGDGFEDGRHHWTDVNGGEEVAILITSEAVRVRDTEFLAKPVASLWLYGNSQETDLKTPEDLRALARAASKAADRLAELQAVA